MEARILVNRPQRRWPAKLEKPMRRAVAATLAQQHWRARWGALPERVILGITLADDATLQDLNARFLGKDRPTNILSFAIHEGPLDGASPELGELFLSYETVFHEATTQGKRLQDHVVHLIIHGVLHLLGYDHARSREEAEKQEESEIGIIAGLGIANPYE